MTWSGDFNDEPVIGRAWLDPSFGTASLDFACPDEGQAFAEAPLLHIGETVVPATLSGATARWVLDPALCSLAFHAGVMRATYRGQLWRVWAVHQIDPRSML